MPAQRRVRIAMNGVTGRMGYRQHLVGHHDRRIPAACGLAGGLTLYPDSSYYQRQK
jgi:hypothetical protein